MQEQSIKQQKKVMNVPDANDSFAQVELFLWQYGELPKPTDTRRLDINKALDQCYLKIMQAGKEKDMSKMPSPFGVACVMKYLTDNFEFNETEEKKLIVT